MDVLRHGTFIDINIVLDDESSMALDAQSAEDTLTLGVAYNQRVLTAIVHQDDPKDDQLYAKRFDKTVEMVSEIKLLGDKVDGQFAELTVFDDFMSRDYLQKCTWDADIVEAGEAACPDAIAASLMDLTALTDDESIMFEENAASGVPEGVHYVTEGGLHLTDGSKFVIQLESGESLAMNPFTVKFLWRSREPHNEDGSLNPFDGTIARIPLGDVMVEQTEVGMQVSLAADMKYDLGIVQNPENYHLIVISSWNEDVFVRIDDHVYWTFRLESEFSLKDQVVLEASGVSGEFLDLEYFDKVHDRYLL